MINEKAFTLNFHASRWYCPTLIGKLQGKSGLLSEFKNFHNGIIDLFIVQY